MQTLSGRAVLPLPQLLLLLPPLLGATRASVTPPCEPALSVVVDSLSISDNGTLTTAWGASYAAGTYWQDDAGETRICPCNAGPCLRKCCPLGQAIRKGNCTDVDVDPDDFRRRHANFSLLYGHNCLCGRYLAPGGTYNLLSNGFLNQSSTEINPPGDFCLEDFEDGEGALVCLPREACDDEAIYQLHKCCPLGQAIREGNCTDVDVDPYDFRRRHAGFSLLLGSNCLCGRYLVPGGSYNLLSNGYLNQSSTEINPPGDFCLDDFENGEGALVCFPREECEDEVIYQLYPMGMVISLPCLIATLFVYAVIKNLRNLHGLSLMSYVTCLIVGYTFLAVIQWSGRQIHLTTCYTSAFIIYFSFLASFFWLNVMCLDIFWTFSGFRSLRGSVKEREFKKFIIYSIYSWGCPLIMLTVCLVMHFHEGIPNDYVKPGFGISACWFKDTISALAYFYGPVAVLILCNIILFILTAVKIAKLKREADMFNNSESRRHDDEDNKQRFNLYLKLFLVMGVNWATEIISWAAGGPEYLWYLTDIANTLQGVLIFIIFVWKDRIRKLLMERFCPKRAASATAGKSTAITYSSRGSSSTSSMKPGSKINQESLRMANMATSEESDVP